MMYDSYVIRSVKESPKNFYVILVIIIVLFIVVSNSWMYIGVDTIHEIYIRNINSKIMEKLQQ